MFQIEDGSGRSFFYTIEDLDVGEDNMNIDDDGDHCITVTNENEPVSTRKFL